MTNASWWSKAHGTPGGLPEAPGDSSDLQYVQTLGTLTYGKRTARADQYAVPGVGFDLRYFVNDELRETELFKGTDGGRRSNRAGETRRAARQRVA